LKDHFDHVVKSLDMAILLEHVRRLEPAAFARHFKGFRPQMLVASGLSMRFASRCSSGATPPSRHPDAAVEPGEPRPVPRDARAREDHPEDVESIERIEDAKANEFIDELLTRFGGEDILMCVRLNDVRFSTEVIATRLEGRTNPSEPGSAG